MTSSQRYRAALKAGLCGNCKKRPKRKKGVSCEACHNSVLASHRTKYALMKMRNICVQCKKVKAVVDRVQCAACREKERLRAAKYRENKRNRERLAEARKAKRHAKNLV